MRAQTGVVRAIQRCTSCGQPKELCAFWVRERSWDPAQRRHVTYQRDTVCRKCQGADDRRLTRLLTEESRLLAKLVTVRKEIDRERARTAPRVA